MAAWVAAGPDAWRTGVTGDKQMSDVVMAVKDDENGTILCAGRSVRELERKLALKPRTLEHNCYKGIVNKRYGIKVERYRI